MFSIRDLENLYKCTYPNVVSDATLSMRQKDINAFQAIVSQAGVEHDLHYGVKEERLVLFTTQRGEQIAIQYPGKESVPTKDGKVRPFDFRPKIITASGLVIKDMAFVDLWGVVENLAHDHRAIIKVLSALFFRMGRMLVHQADENDYPYTILDADGQELASGTRHLSWHKLSMSKEICDSFNLHIPEITLDDRSTISFEAFIYFFEMLLQNEDSKYFYIKGNLSSGRIQTSDSMLQLSSYFNGTTSLSTLLQRYISGFGVAKCPLDEIHSATGGLVTIVNRREQILSLLNARQLPYRTNAVISRQGKRALTAIKVLEPQIAILRHPASDSETFLSQLGWHVFDLDSLVDPVNYNQLISIIP